MRRLRVVSQQQGEFQWRLELLDALNRMRVNQQVANRALIQSQARLRKEMAHLTPAKLALLINAQIEEKRKEQDAGRYRAGLKSLWQHLVTAGFSIAVCFILWKLKK